MPVQTETELKPNGFLSDVVAMSASTDSTRILCLHFNRDVTDADRAAIVAAHNEIIRPSPAQPESVLLAGGTPPDARLLFSFSQCLRHAFMTGAGYGELERISDDDLKRFTEYNPPETGSFAKVLSALAAPAQAQGAPVGEAGEMPGSNGGFTMAAFKATDVPVGTKLYAAPQPAVAVGEVERLKSAMQEAIDLLLERKAGSPARSASHNARVTLQFALTGDVTSPLPADLHGSEKGEA